MALAAAVISAAYGVPAGSSEAPVAAVAAVAVVGVADASEAKFVFVLAPAVPWALASAVENAAGLACGAGARHALRREHRPGSGSCG